MCLGASREPGWTAQALRFGLAGALVTLTSTLCYLAFACLAGIAPELATLFGYAFAVVLGYHLHSTWTFRDARRSFEARGERLRFMIGSLSSLLLNLAWAVIGDAANLPPFAAAIPMTVVTPITSFLINRHWVFAGTQGSHGSSEKMLPSPVTRRI